MSLGHSVKRSPQSGWHFAPLEPTSSLEVAATVLGEIGDPEYVGEVPAAQLAHYLGEGALSLLRPEHRQDPPIETVEF
jgi:hypothetical protein